MNKYKYILSSLLTMKYPFVLSIFISFMFISCGNKHVENSNSSLPEAPSLELTETLWSLNENLPSKTSTTVTMEKAIFDLDNRLFQFNYSEVWPDNVSVDSAQVLLDKTRISTLEQQLENDYQGQNRAFLQLLVKNNYGIKIQYVGVPSNDTISTSVSVDEIKELLSKH